MPTMTEKNAENVWETTAWASDDGDVARDEGAAMDFETTDCNLVEGLECLGHACQPYECLKVETSVGGSITETWCGTLLCQHELGNIGCKRCRCASHLPFTQEGRGDYCPLEDDKTAHETSAEKKTQGYPAQNLGNWILWFLTPQGKARGSRWRSAVTARRWWTGSVARQGRKW